MPFKSEAQRKYLWANEPEIARDWTDTYGSRIEKDDGGIMRLGFYTGGPGPGGEGATGQEIQNPIGGLEQLTPYLNLMDPAIESNYYTNHGDFAATYDPAFGQLEKWTGYPTTYPTKDPYSPKPYYDDDEIIPRLHQDNFYKNFSGINLLPNDFNRNYQSEDANWRTRLKNKGSGIINYLLSGLGKAVNLPLGIMGAFAQGFPNNAQEQAMVDLYGGNTVTSGPMAGYNAASFFGKGLPYATQKRINKRQATLQKMKHWEDWRKKRFAKKTGLLEEELAKQNKALLDQANQVKTTFHRDEPARQGGQNPSAQSFRSAPGGLSQAQSRAARGDKSGTGGGWKW
jgi:hypothetical protein